MENLPVVISNKPLYPSTRLLQSILTSFKPTIRITSSRSPSKPRIDKPLNDYSNLNYNEEPKQKPEPLRKRYNSIGTLPIISATSWCIMDTSSSHWISGHNDTEQREIASLTKIMTCIVCLELIKRLEKVTLASYVKVSYRAARMIGTSAGLRPGDRVKIKALLYALMLPSGNDAAWALAEYFGIKLAPSSIKPVKHFTAEMNKTAREASLMCTNFENPHGLMYKKNVSNARDVAKIACYALKDENFKEIVDTRIYTAEIIGSDGVTRFQAWENTNKLLGLGFNGVKTGVTDSAGPCLCVSAKKYFNSYVIVLLNSRTMDDRWVEAKRLADWVNGRYC